jgi:hypothetical protein
VEGSRRIAWELLQDHGPPIGLPHAPAQVWWQALADAYHPSPRPTTAEQWWQWANTAGPVPLPTPAGPQVTAEHRRAWGNLQWGLHRFLGASGLGENYGRDFVVRLGEDALTPDQIVIDRARHANLTDNYLKGPPTIAIEVIQANTAHFDREVKFRLHERAGTPEYWLFDPFAQEAQFWRLVNGAYERASPDAAGVYRSAALPGLALLLPDLWALDGQPRLEDCRPFLPPQGPGQPSSSGKIPVELGWDSVPFAPRLALTPQPIRFEEFISWCGRAKFESYGKGLTIGGSEATRRVFAMLVMTFGLVEIVRLAHPRDWVTFLAPEVQPSAAAHVTALLKRATYEEREALREGETYWSGTIPGISWVRSYGETEQKCRDDLAANVREWVLLRLARGEEVEG